MADTDREGGPACIVFGADGVLRVDWWTVGVTENPGTLTVSQTYPPLVEARDE